MEEGISFNMVLSATTLVSVLTLIYRIWRTGKPQKIEQPLDIQSSTCDRQIKSNRDEHENIFARLGLSEQRISTLEAHNVHTTHTLDRIEGKVDKLIEQERKK